MPKRIAGLLGLVSANLTVMCLGFGIAFAWPSPAQAEVQYPWCAEYGGREAGGVNCGFETLAQCRANISGIGGWCYENPAYPAAAPRPTKPTKKR